MSNFEKLLKHERSVPYTFISTILAVAGFVAAIYFSMFYEKSPKLDIEVMSQFSALDIKESVNNLDVIYDNNSLNAQGKSLTVIELKISNSGSASILRTYYDPDSKAGFKVNQGIIPEPPLLTSSKTSYAHDEIPVERLDNNSLLLPQLVMNPGDFYTIKVIVLHDSSKKPVISSFGVIAGTPKIEVLPRLMNEDKRTIFARFFDGSLLMNISRFLLLGFAFFIFTMLIIGSVLHCSELLFKKKVSKLITQFKKCNVQRISTVPSNFFTQLEKCEKRDFEKYLKAVKKDSDYSLSIQANEFEALGVIQISDSGRCIKDEQIFAILKDFLNLLIEENVIEDVVIIPRKDEQTEDSLENELVEPS